MQLTIFWAALVRRWYLVLVALACTVVVTVLVVNRVGPTYQATGSVLLLPPMTTVRQGTNLQTDGNPYLMLGGLNQARDIVIRAVQSKATREEVCQSRADPGYEEMRTQLCGQDPTVSYEVTQDYTTNAPIVVITVDAKSPRNAVTGELAMMERVPKALVDLQAELQLKSEATITSKVLITDKAPDVVRKTQIRAGIVAAAGTLSVTLLLIGLFDGLVAVRRARRQTAGRRAQDALDDFDDELPAELGEWPEDLRPTTEASSVQRDESTAVRV